MTERTKIISENGQSNVITFTKKEMLHMDKTFKKHFILNGYIVHVRKRKRGKTVFTMKYDFVETVIISARRRSILTKPSVSF